MLEMLVGAMGWGGVGGRGVLLALATPPPFPLQSEEVGELMSAPYSQRSAAEVHCSMADLEAALQMSGATAESDT